MLEAHKDKESYDLEGISKAYRIARGAHEGQTRQTGEEYVTHPVSVACILVELGMDSESVIAALLHDVVEDTQMTLPEIKDDFGEDIAALVDGVTKLGKIPYTTKEEQQAENLRKMLLAMSEDIRVIIIKLCDRLHNMRTLSALTEEKQLDKSKETLEVYAPIAHRLGIRAVKEELEDLAIQHLDPVAYEEIRENLESRRQQSVEFLENVQKRIKERLRDIIPNVYLEGREKSVHGIYRKMYMQGKTFDEIYDIYAVRIIVDTVIDCYNVLGVIHDMFSALQGRFKDYISTPKPNLYQSLHTTLISREEIPFEVQIRTWEMHQTAEYGIAAHWKYKAGVKKADARMEERLAWIRQLLESQKETDDVEEIVRTIKTDLAQEDVFVVTPKGDVKSLPVGSTVIDFAYAIHSAIGNRMTGAKVNGRIVPIDYQVRTGEVVEILTTSQQSRHPSRDWLKIVKTSEARSKIRAWFKKERRAENIVEGKNEIEKEFRRNRIAFAEEQRQKEFLEAIAKRQHCEKLDDFYASVGYGGILLSRIMPQIKEDYNKLVRAERGVEIDQLLSSEPVKRTRSSEGVVVEGIDNCLIKLSRCCSPLPGDEIVGFITRGHGVSIHKRNCTNVPQDISSCEEPERWIKAYWEGGGKEKYKSTLLIHAIERDSLLADITLQLANMHVGIHAINARELRGGSCQISLTVSTENLEHLQTILSRLTKVDGVVSIERSVG
ncbi:MAG TPA: (p)ppGpp synthetase [Ruminococcaceae bacterium]|nr:(p)ppGpp synthetase [Oscillospiraceae bacterium]